MRRLSFDLLGLPPSRTDIQMFLADPRPTQEAVVPLVDRYLSRPEFGERWARHWMDVVRYAETAGHVTDPERDNAWQYRDYLIRAFNADVPYDQFIWDHLAADLVDPVAPQARLAATGFLWFHEMHFKPVDPMEQRGQFGGRPD